MQRLRPVAAYSKGHSALVTFEELTPTFINQGPVGLKIVEYAKIRTTLFSCNVCNTVDSGFVVIGAENHRLTRVPVHNQTVLYIATG